MKIYSQSDIGLVRDNNQDFFDSGSISENCAFAIVCDGMGGANGGGTASQITVKFITENLEKFKVENMHEDEIKDLLIKLSQDANTKVFEISKEDESLSGMGTTIVFSIISSNLIHLVHAGDSRAYIISGEEIVQITRDHSIVQELVESGEITTEQARNHPRKNVITRALGVNADLELDYYRHEFKENDALLICTDGLTNYLNDSELLKIINNVGDEKSVDSFISEAKKRGGSDNITVVLIRN